MGCIYLICNETNTYISALSKLLTIKKKAVYDIILRSMTDDPGSCNSLIEYFPFTHYIPFFGKFFDDETHTQLRCQQIRVAMDQIRTRSETISNAAIEQIAQLRPITINPTISHPCCKLKTGARRRYLLNQAHNQRSITTSLAT